LDTNKDDVHLVVAAAAAGTIILIKHQNQQNDGSSIATCLDHLLHHQNVT
jgi:hypothetical protein